VYAVNVVRYKWYAMEAHTLPVWSIQMSALSKLNAHIKLLPSFEHTIHTGVVFLLAEINNSDLHRCRVTNARVHLL